MISFSLVVLCPRLAKNYSTYELCKARANFINGNYIYLVNTGKTHRVCQRRLKYFSLLLPILIMMTCHVINSRRIDNFFESKKCKRNKTFRWFSFVSSRLKLTLKMSALYAFLALDELFLLLSTVGNLLVIIVMFKEKQLRASSTNIYIVTLSIADLFVNLIAVPYSLAVVKKISLRKGLVYYKV